jgi:predicted TIM-barrel fold metal-dependent hydrolase
MAGCAVLLDRDRAAHAAVPQPQTKVNFDVPPGACDCHVHVFGDPKKYPFFEGRSYSPEPASVEDLQRLLSALRLERVVIVQPSVSAAI